MSCLCHAFAFVHCCLVDTWREMVDLLALVCDVYCDFVTFPFGILGQVWYLIASIFDPCCLSYFLYLFIYRLLTVLRQCFIFIYRLLTVLRQWFCCCWSIVWCASHWLWGFYVCLCFVVHYFLSFLVLQSSWRWREIWLLFSNCLTDVLLL